MKPFYGREMKVWGIKNAKRPQKGFPVSGVVSVSADGVRGCQYVKFSERLVIAIGLAMPYGVAFDLPCFLRVVKKFDRWDIFSYYIDGRKGVWLWSSKEKPEWLKWIG